MLALRERDREWLRRSFAAKAVADPVDFVMLAAGRDVPLTSRLVGGTLAADSAAVAAAYARQVLGFGGAPLDTAPARLHHRCRTRPAHSPNETGAAAHRA